ncbi:hypothetical protein Ssi03_02710 [Sphaerisporangium siamense]|uniref:Uncharacterized protein n=1 Tax=Sphaerisporangium siamense TaxID=795645 RepID=A0A7W7DBL3_9ACTN|nr:hypothetical protein [Sphaerisporangium siamense]MBB4703812.1 hypothetical protein [Sphaerisporangium siamense]GII82281.1 hypothetical protein Ssi03_02710 [Sphaerisporangium siamense]
MASTRNPAVMTTVGIHTRPTGLAVPARAGTRITAGTAATTGFTTSGPRGGRGA